MTAAGLLRSLPIVPLAMAVALAAAPGVARAQQLSDLDRARARMMLRKAHDDLRRHYYDTTYAGIDLRQRFDSAEQRLDRAQSNSELFGVIARAFVDLNDSHTWFVPPERANTVRFGWELLAIGDSVYVGAVRPGTGVDSAGLRPGDRVVSVNGFRVTRDNLWKMHYAFQLVRPVAELQVILESPGEPARAVVVPADIRKGKARVDLSNDADMRDIYLEWADADIAHRDVLRERSLGDVLVWDLDAFDIEPNDLDARMRNLRRHQALVLDLRGNPGGYVKTLQRAVGLFIEGETLIATGRTRAKRGMKVDTVLARPMREPFAGRLVVLVDSRSASASEMFARLVQLHRRGMVIGDRTAGSVVTSRFFPHTAGGGRVVPYGFSISVRDVVMPDGERLEGRGMMPDEIVRPTAADLAAGRDPVLALGIALAGGGIDPVEAGKLFPTRWDE